VHKKWYDLTGFEHPGGPAALDHMYRRDGTVLFEMHHPLSDRKHLFSTLAKYEITEPKGLAAELEVHGESFKWPENPVEMSPFRTDVVNATKAYFQKVGQHVCGIIRAVGAIFECMIGRNCGHITFRLYSRNTHSSPRSVSQYPAPFTPLPIIPFSVFVTNLDQIYSNPFPFYPRRKQSVAESPCGKP
jgi:hypothetical protein